MLRIRGGLLENVFAEAGRAWALGDNSLRHHGKEGKGNGKFR